MAKLKLSDIKPGDTLKMKGDSYGANGYAKGDLVTVVYKQNGTIQIKHLDNPHIGNINVYLSNLDFYLQSKTQIEEEITKAKAIITEGEAKLQWMKDTKNEEFDEDEFKVWSTLQILAKKGVTDVEKAKAIAALIKKS